MADVVLWARDICAKVTDAMIERKAGRRIRCRKGCSACCHYLVPLSVPETFRLSEDVDAMPASRRDRAQIAWLSAARRMLDSEIPELPAESAPPDSHCEAARLQDVSDWYSALGILCPFLDRGICTVYEQRPLSCREYFVTGSAHVCAGGPGRAEKLDVPVRMSEVLGRLAAELEDTPVEVFIMPLALVWAQENQLRARRTWPTEIVVERFTEIMRDVVSQGSPVAVG